MDAAAPPPPAVESQRLLSLDAFRGATILAMILVNNPGSWTSMYWPLGHAEWHSWTPTDLIFPFFLFIVGASLAYSLRKYRDGARVAPAVYWRIVRRAAVLFALGLGLALFGKLCDFAFLGADGLRLDTLRIPGVLQRIALVYLAASLLALWTGPRVQVVVAVALLAGYWAMLVGLPRSEPADARLTPEGNVVRAVDRALLGDDHMYTQGQRELTDPEGLLSTLPAIVTALLGYWSGLAIQRRGLAWQTVAALAACGLALAAAGQALHELDLLPINKKLWTSSFVLLTGGLAMVALAGSLALFDLAQWRAAARPLVLVGVNAITAFVGSGLLARLLGSTSVGSLSTQAWLYRRLFANDIADPRLASLGYALATVAFWWLLLYALARRGWTWRV
jgi:predicted acyltransferase